jgi:hypothetical protein
MPGHSKVLRWLLFKTKKLWRLSTQRRMKKGSLLSQMIYSKKVTVTIPAQKTPCFWRARSYKIFIICF